MQMQMQIIQTWCKWMCPCSVCYKPKLLLSAHEGRSWGDKVHVTIVLSGDWNNSYICYPQLWPTFEEQRRDGYHSYLAEVSLSVSCWSPTGCYFILYIFLNPLLSCLQGPEHYLDASGNHWQTRHRMYWTNKGRRVGRRGMGGPILTWPRCSEDDVWGAVLKE